MTFQQPNNQLLPLLFCKQLFINSSFKNGRVVNTIVNKFYNFENSIYFYYNNYLNFFFFISSLTLNLAVDLQNHATTERDAQGSENNCSC